MKKLSLLPFLLLFIFSISLTDDAQAQELTTFILVRHAEKADDGTKDPALSEEGKSRAQRLAAHLNSTDLTAVYSTPYHRTRSTVEDIAESHNLQILEYEPFAGDVFDEMLENNRGGIILISGHSNTTPHLVNTLIGNERYSQLDESDYDNLFVVTLSEIGKGKVLHLLY